MSERILIIDFGSQVTQLIARRVRESGVYCEIHPFNKVTEKSFHDFRPKAVILSGGPSSVTNRGTPRAPGFLFRMGLPVLGICYGQQTMVQQLGGKVETADHHEYGRNHVEVTGDCELFHGVWEKGARETVWMSHGDRVIELPPGFKTVGASEACAHAAIADDKRRFYGVQFHPEVVHTPHGSRLLENFTRRIAGCSGEWTMKSFLEQEIGKLRRQVGDERVICGLSGGVDSSVAAALLHKAIGDRLSCVFVDTGLLRMGEANEVAGLFSGYFKIPLIYRDASKLFLKKLKGVAGPEAKRKIIGKTFIEVFEEEASKVKGARFLAQGTLYPDVIESVSFAGGPSVTIKSHHNVGGLPERMKLELVEPLRELFKDEVRELGRELKLTEKAISRHPFPGPGLAIRIPGEVTAKKLDILRRADAIYLEEIRAAGLYNAIWQAFCVLLPVRSVGVMGDARTYDHVCAMRAVTSTDGMTADYYPFSHDFLGRAANRIINEVKGVNRVVYDVTSKPPGTIEWE